MSLYIDLSKVHVLHKERLIQRRVAVRHSDGRTTYRMQWVLPNGKPVSSIKPRKQIPVGNKPRMLSNNSPTHHYISNDNPYEGLSQKEAIKKYMNSLKPRQKTELLEKHGVEWDKHESPQKDRINAIMALTQFLHDNPHVLGKGFEHLPKESVPQEDKVHTNAKDYMDFLKKKLGKEEFKQHVREFVQKHGLQYEHKDHELIDHMSRYKKMQDHLGKNPHLMTGEDKPTTGHKPEDLVSEKSTQKPTGKSNKTGLAKDVDDVLKGKTEDQKWQMVKEHNIDYVPHEKEHAITRMRAFSALARHLVKNPEILGLEKSKTEGEREETQRRVNEIMVPISKENKLRLLEKYGKQLTWEHNDHPAILHKNKVTALKDFFIKNPDKIPEIQDMLKKQKLGSVKISTNDLESVIRHFTGWGNSDSRAVKDPDIPNGWSWGIASMASIVEKNGKHMLSIVNDEEGQFEEKTIPMEDVVDFIGKEKKRNETWGHFSKRYKNKDIKSFLEDVGKLSFTGGLQEEYTGNRVKYSGKVIRNGADAELNAELYLDDNKEEKFKVHIKNLETGKSAGKEYTTDRVNKLIDHLKNPLHEQSLGRITSKLEKALNNDNLNTDEFDKLYTPAVARRLRDETRNAIGTDNDAVTNLMGLSHLSNIPSSILDEMMARSDIQVDDHGNIRVDDNFNRFRYGHLIEKSKQKNANDYMIHSRDHYIVQDKNTTHHVIEHNPWVLQQSGRLWTPEQRSEARRDLISTRISVQDADKIHNMNNKTPELARHIHQSLDFVPFDLFTDVIGKGSAFKFQTKNGAHYNPYSRSVYLPGHYLEGSDIFKDHSQHVKGPMNAMGGYKHWSLGSNLSHEFAHAVHHFLSGHYLSSNTWNIKENKYLPPRLSGDSLTKAYWAAVDEHGNRKLQIHTINGEQRLYYVDKWADSYQGRIYGTPGKESGHGAELFSTTTEYYANTINAYKKYREDKPDKPLSFNKWVKGMYKESLDHKEQHIANGFSPGSYKPLSDEHKYAEFHYHNLKNNPVTSSIVQRLFNRGDYVDKDTLTHVNQIQKEITTRKSENELDLLLYF